jgi:hypothetical protein
MKKQFMFLMCLLLAMVWTAGCSCPGVRPVVAPPAPVVEPAPPPPPAPVVQPAPVEEPAPSKKLKKRVIY